MYVVNCTESADDQRAREILEATVLTPSDRYQISLEVRWCRVPEQHLKYFQHCLTKIPEVNKKSGERLRPRWLQELEESDPNNVWYQLLEVVVIPRKPDKLDVVWYEVTV